MIKEEVVTMRINHQSPFGVFCLFCTFPTSRRICSVGFSENNELLCFTVVLANRTFVMLLSLLAVAFVSVTFRDDVELFNPPLVGCKFVELMMLFSGVDKICKKKLLTLTVTKY